MPHGRHHEWKKVFFSKKKTQNVNWYSFSVCIRLAHSNYSPTKYICESTKSTHDSMKKVLDRELYTTTHSEKENQNEQWTKETQRKKKSKQMYTEIKKQRPVHLTLNRFYLFHIYASFKFQQHCPTETKSRTHDSKAKTTKHFYALWGKTIIAKCHIQTHISPK